MFGFHEITKSIEAVVSDPELAKKVIKATEEGFATIQEKAKEQKVIVKTEFKDELTKELVTKDELKATGDYSLTFIMLLFIRFFSF